MSVNPAGFWPQTHQLSGFEGGDKPGAQLVGFKQATTINTLKIGKKYSIINQNLAETKQKWWTESYENSEGAALVTT